jgi:hypothetical protein
MIGLIPHAAPRLLQLDPVVLLAFIEGVLCETPENAERIQSLYDDAKPTKPADRAEQVARFLAIAGGG